MSIKEFLDYCDDYCDVKETALFVFSKSGFGFGQIYFFVGDDGKTHCHNECMSKENVKYFMNMLIDNAIFDDS